MISNLRSVHIIGIHLRYRERFFVESRCFRWFNLHAESLANASPEAVLGGSEDFNYRTLMTIVRAILSPNRWCRSPKTKIQSMIPRNHRDAFRTNDRRTVQGCRVRISTTAMPNALLPQLCPPGKASAKSRYQKRNKKPAMKTANPIHEPLRTSLRTGRRKKKGTKAIS